MRGPWQKESIHQSAKDRQFRSLIDLGTASVKALVVEVTQRQAHVWGHGQASLEGAYGSGGEIIDHEAITAACDAALSAAEEMTCHTFGHKIVPDQSVWSVPGWLCQGQTLTFQQRRSQPTKQISRQEWLALQAHLDRSVTQMPNTPVDIVPSARVDDHPVTDAVGLRGQVLALDAFVVTAAPAVLIGLRELALALELDSPAFVSQARAGAAGLPRSGVVLDVGRWGTNIVIAHSGQLGGMAWAPLGGQSLYRALVSGFGLTPTRLPDFCQAYIGGQLPFETAAAADAALVDPVTRWLDLVAEKLAALATEVALPHRIFLAGGASRLPAVSQGARHYAWTRQFRWPRHPEVHLWQAASLRNLTNHTRCAWDASDLVRLGLARLTASSV